MTTSLRTSKLFFPLIGLLGLAALAWVGARATANDAANTAGSQNLAPGEAAMRATINPETGRVEIRAGEPSALPLDAYTQQALRRDSQGLMERHHPDGSVSVDLQGRYQSASVATLGKDGKVMICTEEIGGAQIALDGNSSTNTEAPIQ